MTTTQSGAPPAKETRRSEEPGSTRITGNSTIAEPPLPVVAYAPAGDRTRWLAIVEVCPRCKRGHHFYGTQTEPPRVRSCCGRTYVLHPVYGGNSEPPEGAP